VAKRLSGCVNAAKNKHNTYKVGKSFAIDCTTRFDNKIGGIFLQTAIERGANGSQQFKQLDSSQPKLDLQLSFCVNMLNLAVKPDPYILYCYLY